MNLETFLQRRKEADRAATEKAFRDLCVRCLQPQFGCYCGDVQTFYPGIKFVILIHPIEMKRRIATGRMSHIILENSELILGQDYSNHRRVNALIQDPAYSSVVLYPGRNSLNLSCADATDKGRLFPKSRLPLIFVVDGTWATAIKMMRQSRNLAGLPRICFTPPGPSQFKVRKQPTPECYSTIEAIHHTIELIGDSCGFGTSGREHDKLIRVFEGMVNRQLTFVEKSISNPRVVHRRRYKVAADN